MCACVDYHVSKASLSTPSPPPLSLASPPGSLRAAACDVAAVSAACGTLCNSADLRRLLGVTLWLGNALNGNSFRGSAEGFRTDALPRLAELRTNSTPPSSLLAVAVQHCAAASDEGWAALERLAQQLGSVKAAARISMTEIR